MTVQITLIGLGQVGTSVGLALKDHKDLVRRVGHDRDPGTARQAEKMGALDQVSFNLPSAVRQADIVFLAEPFNQSRETLQIIAQDLKAGAVVMDTAPVKVSASESAAQILPAERYYVSLTPTLNPLSFQNTAQGAEAATADLFKNSLMVITAPTGTNSEAIKLATDLTGLLGATPFFGDPYEMDGLLATTTLLPQLTAAALVLATASQPGWREARKVAGRLYAEATAPVLQGHETRSAGQAALLNSANAVRVLDDLILALETLRTMISESDETALLETLEQAAQQRERWLHQRQQANWVSEDYPQTELPTGKDFIGRMFGLRKRQGSGK